MAAESASEQQVLGIVLTMDATGMVTGASLAEQSLEGVKQKARTTQTEVDHASQGMANSMKVAGGLMAAGLGGMELGHKLKESLIEPMIEQSETFEVKMAQLGFVAEATGEEFKKLKDFVIGVGVRTQFSPQEAAEGLQLLVAAGMDTAKAMETLDATLDLTTASAGELDLSAASAATAAALLKFSGTGESARQIMNELADAARLTNIQFHDFPIFLNSMRDAPASLKLASKEAFALVGVMRNAGLMAAEAGAGVSSFGRTALIRQRQLDAFLTKNNMTMDQLLTNPPKKMPETIKAFTKFGIKIFDGQGQMRNMIDLFGDILDKSKTLNKENEKDFLVASLTLFGSQGKAMIQSLLQLQKEGKTGSEALRALVDDIGDSEGVARTAAETFENTGVGLDKFIEGSRQTVAVLLGTDGLLPILHAIGIVVRDMTNAFIAFIQENPAVSKALAITLFLLTGIVTAGSMLLLTTAGLIFWNMHVAAAIIGLGGFKGALNLTIASLGKFMLAMLPFIAGVLGAFLLIVVGIKVWNAIMADQLGDIGFFIKGLVTDIKLIWEGLVDFWDGEGSVDLLNALDARGLTGFVVLLGSVGKKIVAFFKSFAAPIIFFVGLMGKTLLFVAGMVGNLLGWFIDLFTKGVETKDRRKDIKFWSDLGTVMGFLVSAVIPILMIQLTKMAVLWAIQTGRLIATNALLVFQRLVALPGLILQYAAMAVALTILNIGTWAWVAGLVILGLAIFAIGFFIGLIILKVLELLGFVESGTVKDAFGGAMDNWLNDIITFVVEGTDSLITWMKELPGKLADAFVSAASTVGNFIGDWFETKMQGIRDMMPGSDAKVGPLSDLMASGKALLGTLQLGVDQATPGFFSGLDTIATGISQALNGETPTGTATTSPGTLPLAPGVAPPATPAGKTISVVIQKLELLATKATPEEAQRLAEMVLERIGELTDQATEVEFA